MTTTLIPGQATTGTLGDLAAAYGLASRLVLAPADDMLLIRLAEPGLLSQWPLHHCSETIRGLGSLRRSLLAGEDVETLTAEYHRLFAASPSVIPLPYESAYRPNEPLFFDVPTFEVRDRRQVYGLQAPPPAGRCECDHLGLELAYAGRLCLAALEATERGDDATATEVLITHRDFLERHLLRWAPGCLREVEAAADTQFYRGAAALALGVLAHAHARLP